jgi:hypothetical protein
MMSQTLSKWTQLYLYKPPWRPYFVIGIVFVILGVGLSFLAEWLECVSEWLSLLILLPAYALFLFSFVAFFGVSEMLVVWALGHVGVYARVLIIPDDGLWLSNGTRFLGPSSIHIPFAAIAWVKPKRTVRGVEHIQIVYDPDLKTEFVDMIRPADFDKLLTLLETLCPNAFVSDPPVGYVFSDQ